MTPNFLSEKSILVYDYGNFLEVAQCLSKSFREVFYYCPYVINGFPEHQPYDIGRNVPGIIKVREVEDVLSLIDMVMFCDCYEPAKQAYFESMGIPVFGGKRGVELETNREFLKTTLEATGLPYSPYKVVTGIDELSMALRDQNDVYVKSNMRGDMETWKHLDYRLSRYKVDKMRSDLNVFQTQPRYLIDSHIDAIGEIGLDTFVVNGMYPEMVMAGLECKDSCYVCKILPYRDLPKQLTNITDRLSDFFMDFGYKGWFSDEAVIGKDMQGYLLDATCRMPAPPTSLLLEMIVNFPECVWNVAHGVIPKLEYHNAWGVEIIIKSDIAEKEPVPLLVPDEFKNRVKIKNLVIDEDGTWVYTPNKVKLSKEIGSVIGYSNILSHAIEMAEEVANSIKGMDISIDTKVVDEAKIRMNTLTRNGIKFI